MSKFIQLCYKIFNRTLSEASGNLTCLALGTGGPCIGSIRTWFTAHTPHPERAPNSSTEEGPNPRLEGGGAVLRVDSTSLRDDAPILPLPSSNPPVADIGSGPLLPSRPLSCLLIMPMEPTVWPPPLLLVPLLVAVARATSCSTRWRAEYTGAARPTR